MRRITMREVGKRCPLIERDAAKNDGTLSVRNQSIGILHTVLLSALLCACVVTAHAFEEVDTVTVDIPSLGLADALILLSTQADIQVLYSFDVVHRKVSPAVSGSLPFETVMNRLLEGTGLQWHISSSKVLVVALPDSWPNDSGKSDLVPIGDDVSDMLSNDGLVMKQTTSSDAAVDEIVVTALKRRGRSLNQIAIGISAIDGSTIDSFGADSLTDVLQLSPGVSIDSTTGTTTNIQIRGINSTFGAASVGFYMDELPFSLININLLPDPLLYDLDRIEVLRGPQGTLYGAGTSGGVVRILTLDPVLQTASAKLELSLSDTRDSEHNLSMSGVANVPIVRDKLAIRGVLSYQDNSGWTDDSLDRSALDLNDDNRFRGRIKILAEPTDEIKIKFVAARSHIENDFGSLSADDSREFPQSPFGLFSFSKVKYSEYGSVVRYEFPKVVVQNSLSYADFDSDNSVPFLFALPGSTDIRSLVNELRLNPSGTGELDWVAGIFYRDSEQHLFQDASNAGLPANIDDQTTSKQYSVYTDGTLRFLSGALEVGAGISYFRDETRNVTNLMPVVATQIENNVSTHRLSPQVTIAAHPRDDVIVYLRYAEGFRAATVDFGLPTFFAQSSVPGITGAVDTEDITAYELGIKGDFLGRRLFYEGAIFYNDIDDLQQSAAVIIPDVSVPAFTVLNAGQARSFGIESSFNVKPTDELSISFSGSYTKSEITEDFFAPGSDLAVNGPLFAKGSRLNLVPELTLAGQVTYSRVLGQSGLSARFVGSAQYSSDRAATILSSPSLLSDDILRIDARVEISSKRWSMYVFAENLMDERGSVSPDPATDALLRTLVPIDGVLGTRLRPRTFGIGIRWVFGSTI